MARRIITEADVEQWVKLAGVTEVVLHDNDTVTALARDTAYELGLRFVDLTTDEPAAATPVLTWSRAVETAATSAKPDLRRLG